MIEMLERFQFPRAVSRFIRSSKGNIAITAAILAPVFMGGLAITADYATLHQKHSTLQNIADAAALATAKELKLAGANESNLQEVAKQNVFANLQAGGSGSSVDSGLVEVTTDLANSKNGVTVHVKETWAPFFAHLIEYNVTPIRVQATAQLAGEDPVCIVGLMDYSYFASIHLDNNAELNARKCGVYSNSQSRYSVRADKNAQLRAKSICSAGGYLRFGSGAYIGPTPTTDCPQIPDPLGERPAPPVAGCKENNLVITSNRTLAPGTYCGGIRIQGTATVTFGPGIYVIKDGPLIVADSGKMIGAGVGFFLTGDRSLINFAAGSTIDLGAPETGPMAGLLFYEDRNASNSFRNFNPLKPWLLFDAEGSDVASDGVRAHHITSNNARRLIGTIYLPKSILLIDANAQVADQSAYTAFVVARLWLREGPDLVLNSDYAATSVPVPEGIQGGKIVLSK